MNKTIYYLFILCFILLVNTVPVPPYPPPVSNEKNDHHYSGTVSVENENKKFYQEGGLLSGNNNGNIGNAPNNSNDNSAGVYNSDTTVIPGNNYNDNNEENNNNSSSQQSPSTTTDSGSPTTSTSSTSSPTSNQTPEKSANADTSNSKKEEKPEVNKNNNKKPSYKGYIIFIIVVFSIVIVLSVSIFIYKKKNTVKDIPAFPARESTLGFKTGNLMEKIQAISVNNSMEVSQNNESPLINYSMASAVNTDLNTSSIKNALEPNKNEHYNKWFDSMKRGLKPPPSRDNNNNNNNNKKGKKKTKVTGNGSLLSVSSSRSKSPDISKSFKSASKDFSIVRNSTDISGHTPTLVSHCSSNGGVYGYKNNKLNKHTSVAMTFGCTTEREDSYQELSSPSRSSNNTSSRFSKISTARTSSQRSLTSFISNSPITQNFKSRISSYFAGGGRRQLSGYDSYRKTVNYESDGTNNVDELSSKTTSTTITKNRSPYISGAEFGNITPKKSINKIDTSIIHIKNDKDLLSPSTANTPVESSYEISTSTEQLIEKQDILNSFLNDNEKLKLDLSFSNYGK